MNTYRLYTATTIFILFLPRVYGLSTHLGDEPAKKHTVREDGAAATVEERARHWLAAGRTKPPVEADLQNAARASEEDESPVGRAAAVRALGEWGQWYVDLLELREKSRRESDYDRRLAAGAVLEKAGLSERTFPVFGERFKLVAAALSKSLRTETDPEVLKETIQSLAKVPRLAARLAPVLLRRIETGDDSVRAAAEKLAKSLPTPPASLVPELIPFLHAKDIEARYLVFKWLTALKEASAPAVPQLTAALRDPAPGIRDSAIAALGAVGPAAEAAVPDLQRLLKKSGRNGALQNALVETLGNIGPAASGADREIADLSYAADTASVALEALGKIAPTSSASWEALRHGITSADGGIRAASIQPLGRAALGLSAEKKSGELAQALGLLKQVAFHDPQVPLRDPAMVALGEVYLKNPAEVQNAGISVAALGSIALASIAAQLDHGAAVSVELADLVATSLNASPLEDRLPMLKKLEQMFRDKPLPFSVKLAHALSNRAESESPTEEELARRLVVGGSWLQTTDRQVIPILVKLAEESKAMLGIAAATHLAFFLRPDDDTYAPVLARTAVSWPGQDIPLRGALVAMGPAGPKAIAPLMSDPDPRVREGAIRLAASEGIWREELADKIAESVDDSNSDVRQAALLELQPGPKQEQHLKKVLAHKGETDAEVLSLVALAIGKLGGADRELPWLLHRTHDKSDTVRLRATMALGHAQDPLARRRLLELLSDPDRHTRGMAIDSVGELPPTPEVIEAFAGILKDPIHGYRAVHFLGRMGPEADGVIPRALEILQGEAVGDRAKENALSFLGSRSTKAEEVVPGLRDALKTQTESVKLGSLGALASLGKDAAAATPEVLAWLENHPKANSDDKSLAMRFFMGAGRAARREAKLPQKLAESLTQVYTQARAVDEVRPLALLALTSVSGPAAAARLLNEQIDFPKKLTILSLPYRREKEKELTEKLLTELSKSDDGEVSQIASRQLYKIRFIRPLGGP